VETTFQKVDELTTRIAISHFYSTDNLKARVLNWIAKGKIARDTQATLNAIKAKIERDPLLRH
jgi:hypothetical protein